MSFISAMVHSDSEEFPRVALFPAPDAENRIVIRIGFNGTLFLDIEHAEHVAREILRITAELSPVTGEKYVMDYATAAKRYVVNDETSDAAPMVPTP